MEHIRNERGVRRPIVQRGLSGASEMTVGRSSGTATFALDYVEPRASYEPNGLGLAGRPAIVGPVMSRRGTRPERAGEEQQHDAAGCGHPDWKVATRGHEISVRFT